MTSQEKSIRAELARRCQAAGVQLNECGAGHFQIRGVQLVNYWPFSKRQTVHIAGTNWRRSFQSPADAVDLAVNPLKQPEHKAWPIDAAGAGSCPRPSPTGRLNQEEPNHQALPGTLSATIEMWEAKHGPVTGSPPWNK